MLWAKIPTTDRRKEPVWPFCVAAKSEGVDAARPEAGFPHYRLIRRKRAGRQDSVAPRSFESTRISGAVGSRGVRFFRG